MKLTLRKNQEKNIEFRPNFQLEVVLFEENDKSQKQSNHYKSKCDGRSDVNVLNVDLSVFGSHSPANFLKIKAITSVSIPEPIFIINVQNLSLGLSEVSGTIIAAPNQPAERFTKMSEIVTSQTGSIVSNWATLAEDKLCVN